MIKPLRFLFAVMLMGLIATTVRAQVDTISLLNHDLITAQLKPGLHQYLVYMENPKKQRLAWHSLWSREVKLKQTQGVSVIDITQHWTSADTTFNRYVYSRSRQDNFAPMYHYTRSTRGVEAFQFTNEQMTAADTVVANARKGFEQKFSAPTLNWELDLEVFSTLPFKRKGQQFVIPFYHPGGTTPPAFYTYTVSGEEKLTVADGRTADCWMLKIQYTPTDWAIFWISKKSHEVLKMQECFRGNYRYKIKLATPVPFTKL